MPKGFCIDCRQIHAANMDTCPNVSERTCGGRKAGKASKDTSRDVSPDASLVEDFSSLSLLEREKRELADIERIELEDSPGIGGEASQTSAGEFQKTES